LSRGGKRPGAGRPRGSPNRVSRDARAMFERFLNENLETILDELCRTKDPRVKLETLRLIASYALGKPRESVHVSHELDFQRERHERALEAITVEPLELPERSE
jgi:hypothetical protein